MFKVLLVKWLKTGTQCAYQARHPGREALFKYDLPNSFVAFLGLICAIGGTSRPCFPDFSLLEAAVTLL